MEYVDGNQKEDRPLYCLVMWFPLIYRASSGDDNAVNRPICEIAIFALWNCQNYVNQLIAESDRDRNGHCGEPQHMWPIACCEMEIQSWSLTCYSSEWKSKSLLFAINYNILKFSFHFLFRFLHHDVSSSSRLFFFHIYLDVSISSLQSNGIIAKRV